MGKSRPSIKTPWGVSFSRPVAYPNTLSFGGAIDPGTLGCPEFWRCYRPRHTNLLTVKTPNTQLLPLPRKMSLSSSTSFFWGYKVFFIWGILYDFLLWRHMVRRWEGELMVNEPKQETWELPRPPYPPPAPPLMWKSSPPISPPPTPHAHRITDICSASATMFMYIYVQYMLRMLMVGGLLFSELDSASF